MSVYRHTTRAAANHRRMMLYLPHLSADAVIYRSSAVYERLFSAFSSRRYSKIRINSDLMSVIADLRQLASTHFFRLHIRSL